MIDEVIKILKNISNNTKSLSIITKENRPLIQWLTKITVYDQNLEKIIRIDSPEEVYKRILICEFFKQKGISIFLSEKILDKTDFCIITEQVPIILWDRLAEDIEPAIKQNYQKDYQRMRTLFDKYGIMWYHKQNVGIDTAGDIRIFDYIANLAIRQKKNEVWLVDAKGVILLKLKITDSNLIEFFL